MKSALPRIVRAYGCVFVRRGELGEVVEFTIRPVAPFRLDLTACVLRRMPINRIDRWDGTAYRRVFPVEGGTAEVSVRQEGSPHEPLLVVETDREISDSAADAIRVTLTKTLGLDIDLSAFYELTKSDPALHSLVTRFAGFKPTRTASLFEALVYAVACQQISLHVGLTIIGRLVEAYGPAHGGHRAFPRPEDIVKATPEDMRALGFSIRKAEYILDIARSIISGEFDPDALADMDDSQVVSRLCNIRGIGRWTAEYVALRGLGRVDIYPADDVGSQNNLQRWMNLPERPKYADIHRIVDKWAPYRGLIYFFLFLTSLERDNLLQLSA